MTKAKRVIGVCRGLIVSNLISALFVLSKTSKRKMTKKKDSCERKGKNETAKKKQKNKKATTEYGLLFSRLATASKACIHRP